MKRRVPLERSVKAAFRLLADSGFGGERSRGWGRSEAPEFIEGQLPDMILAADAYAPQKLSEPSPVSPTSRQANRRRSTPG